MIVVSHSGFLRVGVTGFYYLNADYRIFDYVEENGVETGVVLRQWEDTVEGGMGKSWSHTVPLGDGLPDAEGREVEVTI